MRSVREYRNKFYMNSGPDLSWVWFLPQLLERVKK